MLKILLNMYIILIYHFTQVLCNVESQDIFYDITDALEAQGIETLNKVGEIMNIYKKRFTTN